MRILVVSTQVPFAYGGAEIHAQSLIEALQKAGHEAELAAIPFKWYPQEKVLDHLLACRLLDLTESSGAKIDKVIGLKFPAYHVPHPNKTLWILHQYRSAFEMWQDPACDLALDPAGLEIREAIEQAERRLLPEARKIYTNSRNVASRLKRFCGIDGEPLYHPPRNAEKFYSAQAEDYFYYPSRFAPLKRHELVLRALAQTKKPVRMVFSGNADNPAYVEKLKVLARKLGVDSRVNWLGLVDQAKILELYAKARAVVFPPQDEDYGYITLEGMLASKPILTCHDSGGPLEFVVHEETGLISEASPEDLAMAMDRLWTEEAFAREAGRKGRSRLDEMGVNWPQVVKKLIDED